jgi:hypothetical protein
MEGFLILIPLAIVIAVLLRLAAGGMDHDRIKQYVAGRGGKVLDSSWSPFGPGWFGEKSDRIYAVRYLDGDGNEHEAHCKTSMWTGVYFTEDRVVRYAERAEPAPGVAETLEDENRRLREELERLKREQGRAEPGAEADRPRDTRFHRP